MSEPKLISPLLANHIMGDPISEHHGVRCCPALLKDTDEKFIVKIISNPATPLQLEAMLLSGAFQSKDDALRYYKSLSDDVVAEASLLQKLSRLEGFCCYPSWQVEPMEDGDGYDVYLLAPYNLTLERYLRRNALTHLAAVNLGLDLCAALSVCRRNGYLYVDLKPENIVIMPGGEYRIGDLGFVSLHSLKYASLPERYRSAYTAPEIEDAFSALNTTLDIYAVGLILYQAFNDGRLPAPGEEMTPPAYADYEMSEIILKACTPDPAQRWQDPQEMGQALVAYMQRNAVNDTPIIPIPEPQSEPEDVEEPESEPAEVEEADIEIDIHPAVLEEDAQIQPESEPEVELTEEPTEETPAEITAQTQEVPAEATAEAEEAVAEEASEEETSEAEAEPSLLTEEELEQFVIAGFSDETVPGEADAEALESAALTEELTEILAQADDLIAHKAPDPVVAPEAVEITLPEPEPEPEAEPDSDPVVIALPEQDEDLPVVEEALEDASETDTEPAAETEPEYADEEEDDSSVVPVSPKKKRLRGLIGFLIAVLLALLIAAGAFYYYENYYLQHIDGITITGKENYMTVLLDTQCDNSGLTVTITDTYGNKKYSTVADNRVEFTDLAPGTTYKVSVSIDGFHKLVGTTQTSYTTVLQTQIVGITAVAGDEDGSVILNFSVQGPDNTNWFVHYWAEGEEEKIAACSGHMATIYGLNVGSTYTFSLVPEADLYIVGSNAIEYTALPLLFAQDLAIEGFEDGRLMVNWTNPDGWDIASWTVRCYNTEGFDTTFTVTEPGAAIEVPDLSKGYVVDILADGMTVSNWTGISANSITFSEITFDESVPGQLTVNWEYEGTAPADGWILLYSVDGSERYSVRSDTNSCVIDPLIPGGTYEISFVLSDDITVFGGSATHTTAEPTRFSGYGVKHTDLSYYMCWTPSLPGWHWYNREPEDYTTVFESGDKASVVVYLDGTYDNSDDEITQMYIIRDENGVPIYVNEGRTRTWTNMWGQNYTELDLPVTPETPGSYTVEIYFNDMYCTSIAFTVTEKAEEPAE